MSNIIHTEVYHTYSNSVILNCISEVFFSQCFMYTFVYYAKNKTVIKLKFFLKRIILVITSEISFSANLVYDKNLYIKIISKNKNTFLNSPIYTDLKYAIKKICNF